MVLTKKEKKEWQSVYAKGKRHNIYVKRVGPANVKFSIKGSKKKVYAQLGTGRATTIIDAKIKIKKRRI